MNANILFVKIIKLQNNYFYRLSYHLKSRSESIKSFENDEFDIALKVEEIVQRIENFIEEVITKDHQNLKYKVLINVIPNNLLSLFVEEEKGRIKEKTLENKVKQTIDNIDQHYMTDVQVINKHKGSIYLVPNNIKEEYQALKTIKCKNLFIHLDVFATNSYLDVHKEYFNFKKILLIFEEKDYLRLYRVDNAVVTGYLCYETKDIFEGMFDDIFINDDYDEILTDVSIDEFEEWASKYQKQLFIDLNTIKELAGFDYEKLL